MKNVVKAASLAAITLAAVHANPAPLGKSILEPLGEPITSGSVLFNSRLRFEHADQESSDPSNAFTLRTRLGYQSGVYSGFSFLAEGDYNWALNHGNFTAYPTPGKTVIADGESLDLNRLFLKYQSQPFTVCVGRQDINLLNQRHVGTVAWRQNDQTFDAARFQYNEVPGLTLDYTYNWQVNRIFGSEATTGVLQRFHADNHFFNATYTGTSKVTLGAYAYLLNFSNSPNLSNDTVGLFASGGIPMTSACSFKYHTEWSYQSDNSHTSGADLGEHYIHLRGSVARDKYEAGIGFESLGGNGVTAYQTPLATLHLFNGWADKFLTTPASGLRDFYTFGTAPLCWGINTRLEVHHFTAEDASTVFGQEYGFSLVKKFNDNLSTLVKASQYQGSSSAPVAIAANKTVFWVQLDYTF